jgi:hypothetical protein
MGLERLVNLTATVLSAILRKLCKTQPQTSEFIVKPDPCNMQDKILLHQQLCYDLWYKVDR